MQRAGGCPARGLAWELYCLTGQGDAAKDGAAGRGQRKVQLRFGAGQPTYAAKHGTTCDVTDCESLLLPPSRAACACTVNSPCR